VTSLCVTIKEDENFITKSHNQHQQKPTMTTTRRLSMTATLLLTMAYHVGAFTTVHRKSISISSSRLSMVKKQTVAVIGGGIAGLSCAIALQTSGMYDPTVFDTGRLRPGGRCSSRLPGDVQKTNDYKLLSTSIIDHAAQVLTVPMGFPHFAKQVQQWEAQGIVKRFPRGTVCDISQDPFVLKSLNTNVPMYYGVNGMGDIPFTMSKAIDHLHQDVWVSPSNGVKYVRGDGRNWKVQANGKSLGQFDKMVIAHNGKCADRLMSQTPATELHKLLQVNFAPEVPSWGGKKMTLNSIYSLTFAMHKNGSPLTQALAEDTFISGFVKNQANLRFLSCNTRKHPGRDDIEIWTVLSSANFAKKYKGPQENLPDTLVEEVTGLLLTSLEQSLNLQAGTLRGSMDEPSGTGKLLERRLQLWGAGVPLNTWKANDKEGFLYDAEHGVGTCGDWLLDSSIAGAWESGRRLAEYMTLSPSTNVGLTGQFVASKAVGKVGIGSLE
jgi:predicted NAD/FAD-dependent oxidoreductase